MKTPMLIKPTLEEVRLLAAKTGLPEHEADKFFNHYCAIGWKIGKVPMVSWTHALAGWKLRWQERGGSIGESGSPSGNGSLSGIDKSILSAELERILAKMKNIRDGYGEHQSWTARDSQRYHALKTRRDEIKKKLGIIE